MNLLPDNFPLDNSPQEGPRIAISADGGQRRRADAPLEDQAGWAATNGFAGIEILATGEPGGVHAPSVPPETRERLREALGATDTALAALAPYQETFDITLLSPSSAIRRASVSELWSVCRFVGTAAPPGKGIVLVRTGVAPAGVGAGRQAQYLSESLTTLDRMAGEQGVQIALLNRDWLQYLPNFNSLCVLDLKHTGIALDVQYALDSGQEMSGLLDFLADPPLSLLHVRVSSAPWCVEAFASLLTPDHFAGLVCLHSADGDIDTLLAARELWAAALFPQTPRVPEDSSGNGGSSSAN